MKRSTKKKILTLSLVIALLAIVMVGGSLAWFTDTDDVKNEFTVGSIEIEQEEDFVQNSQLLPIVPNDTETHEDDGNYVKKVVTVKNTGKNPAYIRTHIAVPTALLEYLHLDTKDGEGNNWTYEFTGNMVDDAGLAYTVFSYRYNFPLQPGETSDKLLRGVYMDEKVDLKLNEANGKQELCIPNGDGTFRYSGYTIEDTTKIDVLVATQAVQKEGFESAVDALKAAFDDKHPWAE